MAVSAPSFLHSRLTRRLAGGLISLPPAAEGKTGGLSHAPLSPHICTLHHICRRGRLLLPPLLRIALPVYLLPRCTLHTLYAARYTSPLPPLHHNAAALCWRREAPVKTLLFSPADALRGELPLAHVGLSFAHNLSPAFHLLRHICTRIALHAPLPLASRSLFARLPHAAAQNRAPHLFTAETLRASCALAPAAASCLPRRSPPPPRLLTCRRGRESGEAK